MTSHFFEQKQPAGAGLWTSRGVASQRRVELRYGVDEEQEDDCEPCDIVVPAVIGNPSGVMVHQSDQSRASRRRGQKMVEKLANVDMFEVKNRSFAEGRSGPGKGKLAKGDQSGTASSKQSAEARQKCKTARPRHGTKEGIVQTTKALKSSQNGLHKHSQQSSSRHRRVNSQLHRKKLQGGLATQEQQYNSQKQIKEQLVPNNQSGDWQQAKPTSSFRALKSNTVKRQNSDLFDDQKTVQKPVDGFTRKGSQDQRNSSWQLQGSDQSRKLAQKATIYTREHSGDSSNTSDRRRSSIASGNKTFLQPTPSQQLNQKNKLIEKSRANCIKNLQRLIEQRTQANDGYQNNNQICNQYQLNMNRTTEYKKENVTQSKNSKAKIQSTGPTSGEDFFHSIQKSTQLNQKTPLYHATSCEVLHKNQRLVSTLNNTGEQKHLKTYKIDQRDMQSCTMGSYQSSNVLRSLNLDQRQNAAQNQLPEMNQPIIIQSTQQTARPNNMQTTNTKVRNFLGNAMSTTTHDVMNSCEQILHHGQDGLNKCEDDEQQQQQINGFFFSEYEAQKEYEKTSRSSSPVTQGFSSTQKSQEREVSGNSSPYDQKYVIQIDKNYQYSTNCPPDRQRFIQPLRTMTTKNSKMIDLSSKSSKPRPLQPTPITCHPTPPPCLLNNSCMQGAKALMAQTVHLNFPNTTKGPDKENMNGLEQQNRMTAKPLLYKPPGPGPKYQVNSLKSHIVTNNMNKCFSRNKNNALVTGPNVNKIVENVSKGTARKNMIEAQNNGENNNMGSNIRRTTARYSQLSPWSDYCEQGGAQGFGFVQQIHMDHRMPNIAARGDVDSSPQQLTGLTNSNYKQQSLQKRVETISDYRDATNMQTSNSWSQMQSVSSDSHNKMNKQINTLYGQNYLPEYNRLISPELFQLPEHEYCNQNVQQNSNTDLQEQASSTDKTPSLGTQTTQLRTLLSRNKQNHILLCHASLQGSLTDIQAAPSIMEVDITVGSGAALQKASQRGPATKNGVPSTPTLSQAMPAIPGMPPGSAGVAGQGMPNVPLITTEMTPSGRHPHLWQRGGSTTIEDEAWKRERVQEAEEDEQECNYEVEIEEVGTSIAKQADRVSKLKSEDDDDICLIDKNTTERSCQSPIQLMHNRELCFQDQKSTLRFEQFQNEQELPEAVDVKLENQERLLAVNNVLQTDQQQTGGTDASLIREEMVDQVNELLPAAGVQDCSYPPQVDGPVQEPAAPTSNQIYTSHFQQTLNIMRNIHLLDPYQESYQDLESVVLPEPTAEQKSKWPDGRVKVVFFDIDETMIHCIDDKDSPDMVGDVKLDVMIDQGDNDGDGQQEPQAIQIQINIRPGLQECLIDLSKSFQLVSFTASDQSYADTILDFIDPDGQLFTSRLYRHHCVETQYGLIKDLRIIGNRQLSDLILIDNSALSFALNVNNGIPILPYFQDPVDEELRHLNYYLNCLRDSQVNDVRVHNEEAFGLLRLRDRYGSEGDGDQQQEGVDYPNADGNEDQVHIKLYECSERGLADQSGEYLIRGEDDGSGCRHHCVSKGYLQCDPIEMTDDRMLTQQPDSLGFQQQHLQIGSHLNGGNYVDQPITILNLMGTQQVIEERSNEDEGLTSSQQSPSLKATSRNNTQEELSVCHQQISQLSQPVSQGNRDSMLNSQTQLNDQHNIQSSSNNQPYNFEPSATGSNCQLPHVNQSQIFDELSRKDMSQGSCTTPSKTNNGGDEESQTQLRQSKQQTEA